MKRQFHPLSGNLRKTLLSVLPRLRPQGSDLPRPACPLLLAPDENGPPRELCPPRLGRFRRVSLVIRNHQTQIQNLLLVLHPVPSGLSQRARRVQSQRNLSELEADHKGCERTSKSENRHSAEGGFTKKRAFAFFCFFAESRQKRCLPNPAQCRRCLSIWVGVVYGCAGGILSYTQGGTNSLALMFFTPRCH